MKTRLLFFLFVAFSAFNLFAQTQTIDSLIVVTQSGAERDRYLANVQLSNLFKHNDPQKGLLYANQAIEVAEKLNDAESTARAYQLAAGILFRLGNYSKSKEYYELARTKFSQVQNDKGKAETNYALGGIYYAQGNIAVAVEHYLDALRYYENKKDNAGMLGVYSSLAGLYARQNSFSKSIEYNLKAIALYESSSNTMQALVGYDQVGNAYWKQNNLVKATEFFNKSLRAYTEMKNNAGIASTLNQLGNLAAEQGDYAKAAGLFKRSLEMARIMKTPYLQVMNLNALGKVNALQENYTEAISAYKKAIALAKPANMKLELEEAYQGLSQVYETTRQETKASTFSNLSREIKDSLYNDSALRQLSDLQLRYDSEKKQQQIELLSKEQQIRESELLRERQLKRYFIVVSIVVLIIFVILGFSFIQSKKYSRSLQKQKDELEQRAIEISLQKEKVDQLNAVKDRFFSIISHDLRNNLTAMKLYFDLISNPGYKASDHSEITGQIAGSVENTIDLLENLLVWASAQIKGIPIHRQRLNLHSLAQENINLLSATAAQKNIALVNSIHPDITAIGDMDMINLVFRNLISNAIKFTPSNGEITLTCNPESEFCCINVHDNGIGISKENLERLFDQHSHPTTKGTGNEKGTGLGLLLCKDFIQQNQGKIWVESEKEKGTTFHFTLPVKDEKA